MSIIDPQSLALRSLGDIAASLPGCGGSESLGEELRALVAVTGDMTLPDGACNSWRALYAGLAKLAEDLTEHIHIENNILFPRFEA